MPLRKPKSKAKNNIGIYEYYQASDDNKATLGYFYSYTGADGKTKKVKSKGRTIEDARAERAKTIVEVKEGRALEEGAGLDKKLDDFVDDWIESREKKANAVRDRQRYFNHISPSLGQKFVSAISVNDVKQLRTLLQKKSLATSTIMNILITLKAMLNHAEAVDIPNKRPFNKKVGGALAIKVSKKHDSRMRILDDEELNKLFINAEQIDYRLLFMLQMLFYTAQRPKSILALKCGDINLKKNTIALDEIKGQEATYMPISSKLKPILEVWLEDKEPYQKLIPIGYERMQKLTQKAFSPLNERHFFRKGMDEQQYKDARRAAYKVHQHEWASMYSLRHTAATRILSNTGNIKLAKEVLRHSDLKMTERYAKIVDSQKQDAVDAI